MSRLFTYNVITKDRHNYILLYFIFNCDITSLSESHIYKVIYMKNKQEKLVQLDTELDKIFDELKEVFKKLVFKSMIYRDLHLDNVKEQLEESFDKLSSGLKEKLK